MDKSKLPFAHKQGSQSPAEKYVVKERIVHKEWLIIVLTEYLLSIIPWRHYQNLLQMSNTANFLHLRFLAIVQRGLLVINIRDPLDCIAGLNFFELWFHYVAWSPPPQVCMI